MKRIAGFLIDWILVAAGLLLINLCSNQDIIILLSSGLISQFFCRDCITGQSVGRRITGCCIRYANRPVPPGRAYIRNLFLLLWPVEVFFWVFNHQKRIADIITECHVADSRCQPVQINPKGVLLFVLTWCLLWGLSIVTINRQDSLFPLLFQM